MSLDSLRSARAERIADGLAGWLRSQNPAWSSQQLTARVLERLEDKLINLTKRDSFLLREIAKAAVAATRPAGSLVPADELLDGRKIGKRFTDDAPLEGGYEYWTVVVTNHGVDQENIRTPLRVFSETALTRGDIERIAIGLFRTNGQMDSDMLKREGREQADIVEVLLTSATRV